MTDTIALTHTAVERSAVMSNHSTADEFRTVLSIDPLLEFWREKVSPNCPYMAEMFEVFEIWGLRR